MSKVITSRAVAQHLNNKLGAKHQVKFNPGPGLNISQVSCESIDPLRPHIDLEMMDDIIIKSLKDLFPKLRKQDVFFNRTEMVVYKNGNSTVLENMWEPDWKDHQIIMSIHPYDPDSQIDTSKYF